MTSIVQAYGLIIGIEPRPDGAARVFVETDEKVKASEAARAGFVRERPRYKHETYYLDAAAMRRLLAEYGPERDVLLARRVPLAALRSSAELPGKLAALLRASLKRGRAR